MPRRNRRRRRGDDSDDDDFDDDSGSDEDRQARMVAKHKGAAHDNRKNVEVLDNTLRIAGDIEELGGETLNKLEHQTEQLDRMDDDIAQTNESLDVSGKRIGRMSAGCCSWTGLKGWLCCCCPCVKDEEDYRPKRAKRPTSSGNEVEGGASARTAVNINRTILPKVEAPDIVWTGQKLQDKNVDGMIAAGGYDDKLKPGETVMAFFSSWSTDQISNCIFMTDMRLIEINSGVLVNEYLRYDVMAGVEEGKRGLEFTMSDGTEHSVLIKDPEARDYFFRATDRERAQVELDKGTEQDQMGALSNILDNVTDMALDINAHLKTQETKIGNLDNKVVDTSARLKKETRRLGNIN